MQTRILDKNKRADVRKFKALSYSLYKGNPFWVPPMPGEIERVMDPARHPFYSHSEADFILVENKKEVLARLAILQNKNYCDYHHVKTAFFYYFEAVDDRQVAGYLFDAAQDWAHQRGLELILGARGFLRSNGVGVLVDGFNAHPAMGIPYNLPYYGSLLEFCGFTKAYDLYSGILDKHPDPAIHKIAEKVLARGNFRILDFQEMSEIEPWISRIDEIHHKAFSNNPSFYPSTAEEFDLFSHDLLKIADPKYIKLIMHDDEIAGFILAYPDLNKALQKCKGHSFPLGWYLLSSELKSPSVIDLNGVGLLPEYQGLGGNVLLYAELDKVVRSPKIKRAEVVQVDERNFRSKSDMQNLGVTLTKTHRVYQKKI